MHQKLSQIKILFIAFGQNNREEQHYAIFAHLPRKIFLTRPLFAR